MKEEEYLLVVNASNIEKRLELISAQNDLGVDMKNISTTTFIGDSRPKAVEAMQSLFS
jgi:aminomethyltransferase